MSHNPFACGLVKGSAKGFTGPGRHSHSIASDGDVVQCRSSGVRFRAVMHFLTLGLFLNPVGDVRMVVVACGLVTSFFR
jgi:hypothetical protein